jgi:hypothetical protein
MKEPEEIARVAATFGIDPRAFEHAHGRVGVQPLLLVASNDRNTSADFTTTTFPLRRRQTLRPHACRRRTILRDIASR